MLTAIVMPCLNEAEYVRHAVRSLGFGRGAEPNEDTLLIAIDNGSDDRTVEVLKEVLAESRAGTVHIASELERGFVPPRRHGVEIAADLARERGFGSSDVLILQADADTEYKRGYVAAMRVAAAGAEGAILEGATRRPAAFEAEHPAYVRAERIVDDPTEPLDASDEEEVVVDDKVCGYRLSDYEGWGGLRREWTTAGDEIHVETTRLFIAASLRHRAYKVRVNPAGASPSRRKIVADPALQFATSGFPREAAWIELWHMKHPAGEDLEGFAQAVLQGERAEACYYRRAHQIALFSYLPAIIARAREPDSASVRPPLRSDVGKALDLLPSRSSGQIGDDPGLALQDVLSLIEGQRDLFA